MSRNLPIAVSPVKAYQRMKTCNKCGEGKPLTEFGKQSGRPGLRTQCKACRSSYARAWELEHPERSKAAKDAWRLANPDRRRAIKRRHLYGSDGSELMASQDGVCAICSTDLSALQPGRIHLDHCHVSGKVRGWLCVKCNTGLGMYQDNPARLRLAADYLEKHSA